MPQPEGPEPEGPEPDYHLRGDDFRRMGHEIVEWVADYLDRVESLPVQTSVEPGWVRAQLPAHAPEDPEPWDAIVADLDRVVVPAITNWQSPNWFGYFPANASGASVLGELVSAGLGVQGMSWSTGPACTELETHVLDWLVELLGLPARFRSDGPGGGVIQDSASSAALCAILAARDRVPPEVERSRLRAYTSTQAHSSVEKGMRVAGFDSDQLRPIDVDERFALRADVLAAAIADDVHAGFVPFLVVATVGTTSSMAIDPVEAIADICGPHGVWLHVDAAMAGSAAIVSDFRPIVNTGLERVDSWCFDPHKWLFTNFDCDVFYVADRAPLLHALSVLPEYLRNPATDAGAVIDYRDWHVPLGRRFRALKLWFVLRHYGGRGLRHHIAEHVALAQWFAARIDADDRFVRLAPADLNLVCFRHRDGDARSEQLLRDVNATGRAFLTHTRLIGTYAIRVSIGQTTTARRHVEGLWSLLDTLA